jgi:hypothetical protein
MYTTNFISTDCFILIALHLFSLNRISQVIPNEFSQLVATYFNHLTNYVSNQISITLNVPHSTFHTHTYSTNCRSAQFTRRVKENQSFTHFITTLLFTIHLGGLYC